MFRFLCRTLIHSRNGYSSVTPHYNPSMFVSLSLIKYLSSDAHNPHFFTVSYLTKTCGLSPESALSASKIVRFESPGQPDSVVSCFQEFGFSKSNISQMIEKFPKILCCNPEKIISPKVEFFSSIGASTSDLVKIFTVNPRILECSLENQLVHTFNILIKMFQSEHKAFEIIKKNPYVLNRSPETAFIPNVNSLRENGVPESSILYLIRSHWICIRTCPTRFEKVVEKVKEMRFNPLKSSFVEAIGVFTIVTKSKWDGRVAVYKRWGWSDEDITTAFKKHPLCMAISEDKIMDMMDFYVSKLGVESSVIANCPVLLRYCLKKRLIPRGAVIEHLSSKGLVKLDSNVSTMFICPEMRFLEKYVTCHEEAPHLMKLYNEKLNLAISEGKRKS